MELFGYIIGVIYLVICLIIGVVMFIISHEEEGKPKALSISFMCMLLGPFILAPLIIFEKEASGAKRVIKKGMDIFKVEKHLIDGDAYFLTGSGDKLLISGEFRKEVGLIANKYVKKELDNRRGMW